jgi:hypothetical protein
VSDAKHRATAPRRRYVASGVVGLAVLFVEGCSGSHATVATAPAIPIGDVRPAGRLSAPEGAVPPAVLPRETAPREGSGREPGRSAQGPTLRDGVSSSAGAEPTAPLGALPVPLLRSDPRPPALVRNSHYWISNEQSHYLWREAIDRAGGALVGVGTDQNYLLAGWARSSVIVVLDFDEAITRLHRVYGLLFATCPTPTEFLHAWTEEGEAGTLAALAALPDAEERRGLERVYRHARRFVLVRLRRTLRDHQERGIPTFLDDTAQYDHLRHLWNSGRVWTVTGDLRGDRAMLDTAAALRAANEQIGVLYLSNAEQYFDYDPPFRRNIVGLPFAEHGVVLRTLGWRMHGFVTGEEYHYNLQPGRNFAEWMARSRVKAVGYLLKHKDAGAVAGASVLQRPAEAARTPPQVAPEASR